MASAQDLSDVVLADFEGPDYGSWRTEGTAFGAGPVHADPLGSKIDGFQGLGFASSRHGSDKTTGALISPEFIIERKYLTFLIGGGGWPDKTCLNLLIDGKVARTAVGDHVAAGGRERLRPVVWDLTEYQGRHARIEVLDRATGRWGHISVDHIILTESPALLATESGDLHAGQSGELLYNGIRLPVRWPPVITETPDRKPVEPPYLQAPPAFIMIDVGRQLFVDDFLIEHTDLVRTFHHASKFLGNPILTPTTELEQNGGARPCAAPFDDGVWYDPKDHEFKMWYHAGWFDGTALATSPEGLTWQRPELDVVPGTNRVFAPAGHGHRDGGAVWLDYLASDPRERYKMFLFEWPAEQYGGRVMTAPDGIHWSEPTKTSEVGSNTTIHYNPFRRKWVYSVRTTYHSARVRSYRECDDLIAGATWKKDELVFWAGADALDEPDPALGERPQLYNLDAAPYESIMLGLFNIWKGPPTEVSREDKSPSLTELEVAFSRDGFYWHRPDREPFIAATRKEGDWDRAYLHPTASVCNVVGDRLYFYYSAWSGESPALGADMYAGGATGVALLRRDGFASMDAGETPGLLTTRPVVSHGKYLFVNVDAPAGELRAEILDESGRPIDPYTLENCRPVTGDHTRARIEWQGAGSNLESLIMKKIRVRFQITRGQLYSFWISTGRAGESYGYVAAGGPEFTGPIDTEGAGYAKP